MPYNRPIPDSNPRGKGGALVDSIVQAEKMIQIALVLPCAAFIGWLGGAWLDSALHQKWITLAGVTLGIISGLVAAVRLTHRFGARPQAGDDSSEGPNMSEDKK